MTVKHLLLFGTVAYLAYGLAFFFAPQASADVYGYGAIATPLALLIAQFLGIYCLAAGAMCFVARSADRSPGRTAVLWFVAVSQLLSLYMDIRTMLAGDEGMMNYLDLAVNILLGFGALYFILQERKPA